MLSTLMGEEKLMYVVFFKGWIIWHRPGTFQGPAILRFLAHKVFSVQPVDPDSMSF